MEQFDTRKRLGDQIAQARRKRDWRLNDVAYRSANTAGRISVIENGKANVTVDTLAQLGEAVGLSLVFVPTDKLAQALALGDPSPTETHVPAETPSVYDELFIPDPAEDEEIPNARP
ncbi:helix-turn-helix domain-containing protein [Bradyrhizobium sp. USDA 4473]